MQVSGTRSWRFSETASSTLHAALFVRDTFALAPLADPSVPPPLDADIAPREITDEDRRAASDQWPSWWSALLALEIRLDRGGLDWASFADDRTRAGAAPDFAGLSNRPALQRAATSAFRDGSIWAEQAMRPLQRPFGKPVFDSAPLHRIAQMVAARYAVEIDAVSAQALVFLVPGPWSSVVAPGVLLCSATAADPAALAAEAFGSAITGGALGAVL